jgi:hypothetical protein
MKSSKSTASVSSPLRDLRKELGSDGKRLSTYKLSVLVDIPSATLRSIEAGKNAFTDGLQQRLRRRGIGWNPKTKRWFFAFNPGLDLTVELIMSFNRLSRPDGLYQDVDAHVLCRKMLDLLSAVPAAQYNTLLLDLHQAIEQLAKTYHTEGIEKAFASATPKYSWIVTRSGAQVLDKEYSGPGLGDPEKLLDLRDRRKSTLPGEAQTAARARSDAA